MASTSLFFDIFGRDKGVGAMLDNTGKKAEGMGGKFGGVAAVATRMIAPLAALASAGAIVNYANTSVGAFSKLEDSMAAAEVVFGDAFPAIEAQASSAAKTMGMTKTQAIEGATTFGIYGKSAGLAGADLAGFSTEMTQVAADMASFRGTSPEQAITAVGAAMRGEMEPIRQYGVLLDDATLRNRALEMGLISSVKNALTPQQKALAAQKEILIQTADAQGDFARTADSTANVQKTLSASTADFSAKIGALLAPAFTAARTAVLGFIEGASGLLDRVGPAITALVTNIGPAVQGFFQLSGAVSPFGIALQVVLPVLPALAAALGSIFAAFQPLIPIIMQLVGAVIPPLQQVLAATIPVIMMVINQALIPLIQFLGSVLPPIISALLPIVSAVFTAVAAIITAAMQIVQGIITMVMGVINGNWSQVWSGMQQVAAGVGAAIVAIINGAFNILRSIVSGALSAVAALFSSTWSSVVSGVSGFVGNVVSTVRSLPGQILGALSGLGTLLLGVGRDMIAGLARGITGAAGMIFEAVRGAVGNVVDFAKKILGIGSPSKVMDEEIGRWIPPGIAQGIDRAMPSIGKAMSRVGATIRDFNPGAGGGLDFGFGGSGSGAISVGRAGGAGFSLDGYEMRLNADMTKATFRSMASSAATGAVDNANDDIYRGKAR